MQQARRRLLRLTAEDLWRQHWIADTCIRIAAEPRRELAGCGGPAQRALNATTAAEIAKWLESTCVDSGGQVGWLTVARAHAGDWTVRPAGLSLYDGLPGIALFLSHFGAAVGGNAESLARRASRRIAQAVRSGHASYRALGIGAFDGLAGVAYALAKAGAVFQDTDLQQLSCRVMADDVRDRYISDPFHDVLSGSAGAVLVALELWKMTGDADVLATADVLGRHLVGSSLPMETGRAWRSPIPSVAPLTGLAHGASGIGCALAALYEATRVEDYREAALTAFEYERGWATPDGAGWRDLRRNASGPVGAGWCHGSSGGAIARLLAYRCTRDDRLRDEAVAALGAGASAPGSSLCHGQLGATEAMLVAADVLGDPSWRERAASVAREATTAARSSGWQLDQPNGAACSGLMTGLTGIGMQLLRVERPAQVPSLLCLGGTSPP